jgi:hypothetical protein
MRGEQRNDLEVHALTIGTVIYESGSRSVAARWQSAVAI